MEVLRVLQARRERREGALHIDFTGRQRQVIAMVANGLTDPEIAVELGISPRTARAHCDALRAKLLVPRRREIPSAYRLATGQDPLVAADKLPEASAA
jgi:DNA-binding CsgD family transcriptional regulator